MNGQVVASPLWVEGKEVTNGATNAQGDDRLPNVRTAANHCSHTVCTDAMYQTNPISYCGQQSRTLQTPMRPSLTTPTLKGAYTMPTHDALACQQRQLTFAMSSPPTPHHKHSKPMYLARAFLPAKPDDGSAWVPRYVVSVSKAAWSTSLLTCLCELGLVR